MTVRGSTSVNLGVSRTTKMLSELILQSSALILFALRRGRGKKKNQTNKNMAAIMPRILGLFCAISLN
jgi:hypothetical protein